jgi:arginyl-tRNA synthetase
MIADLKKRDLAVEDDGALVVHVAEEKDGKRPLPPLILEKRDGAATYATTDLATILQRVTAKPPAERILYVVDQRQADHFAQVFRAARKAGVTASLEHVGFGTVNGKDNKALKTRDGGTVKLSDLLAEAIAKAGERIAESEFGAELSENERKDLAEQVGIAAVKFADLSSNRVSGYIFDAERLVSFEGKTGPYLQYACVRITSILAKAEERGEKAGALRIEHPAERALVLECLRFPDVVASAANALMPSEITEYAFTLAQAFSRFYKECPVLAEADPAIRASRLALCQLTLAVLSRSLYLLGIEVPKRM